MLVSQPVGLGAWTESCALPHAFADASPNLAMSQHYAGCASLAPLLQRISYRIIALVRRSLLGLAPAYLRDLCCPTLGSPGRRSLRSTERGVLMVPFARTATKQNRAFTVVGPSLWNWLPLALRLHPRIHSESFYSCLFQPCWGRERPWVVTLKGRYINLRNDWMNEWIIKCKEILSLIRVVAAYRWGSSRKALHVLHRHVPNKLPIGLGHVHYSQYRQRR